MSVKFNKMMAKMKQKLGFTLIEMLIVIAIIAIIVSIGMPMVQISLLKSAAARNAANLRAVEGQISTMRVSNPRAFENLDFKELEDDNVGNKDDFWGSVGNLVGILGSSMATYTASAEGVITLSEELIVTNVPGAAKMTFEDSTGKVREIAEDTPMSVYISKHGAVATYMGIPKEAFAEVADTGKFTGEFGLTDEEKFEQGMGDLDEEIKDVTACKFEGCTATRAWLSGSEYCSDHKDLKHCDICNIDYRGFACPNTDAHGHVCADNDKNHLCDECGTQCSSCNHSFVIGKCSICGNGGLGCPYCAPFAS